LIVLVDGHNALHALGIDAGNHEADRGALIARVRSIARPKRDQAVVFFDGHPEPGAFGTTTLRGVRVVFSEGREADEAIVDAIRAADASGRVVVVTDDLGLSRRATQLGASAVRVWEWFARANPPRDADSRAGEEKPEGSGGFTPADFGFDDDASFRV
jgi:predicted RNA-binding protein with PIN domain